MKRYSSPWVQQALWARPTPPHKLPHPIPCAAEAPQAPQPLPALAGSPAAEQHLGLLAPHPGKPSCPGQSPAIPQAPPATEREQCALEFNLLRFFAP